ncbi:methyltransferase [Hirsutella rhossiliensis]|uniref:Methyltransferase domain-containing protein n=1 Tax=Hirsutella rhossiliensis TaxID=111463 RepID=A0A9P8MRG7_9HYPO|nr:methyltransferase domain-containing protein [Hirsutella rhossiliensis]KAH0958856.1 methyltransferase domain-containing protein [Hirsutella rhossiliensis]
MADASAVNRAYFNKLAPEYDAKFHKARAVMERQVRGNAAFIGAREGGRMLDYACGTGFLSAALGDRLSQCVGIDVSESMVEAYNARARSEGFTPEQRTAHVGNLLDPSDPRPRALSTPNLGGFDVAGVGAGFHHFDDCHLAASRLAQRLRPGGVLLVLDFVAHAAGAVDDAAVRGVRHHGFVEDEVRRIFEGAGVGRGFAFREMDEELVFEGAGEGRGDMVRRVFLARGEKA